MTKRINCDYSSDYQFKFDLLDLDNGRDYRFTVYEINDRRRWVRILRYTFPVEYFEKITGCKNVGDPQQFRKFISNSAEFGVIHDLYENIRASNNIV